MGWESLLLINNLDPMHSVDQEINKVNVVSFCGLRVFFYFLILKATSTFMSTNWNTFLFCIFVWWNGTVRRKDPVKFYKKGVKVKFGWLFERYKFLEYLFCGKISFRLDYWHMTLTIWNCGLKIYLWFSNGKGGGSEHEIYFKGSWKSWIQFLKMCIIYIGLWILS